MIEKGGDYYQAAADGILMPSYSVVSKLFEKEFSRTYGSISGDGMIENVKILLQDYVANKGEKAKFQYTADGEHYFVIPCTPMILQTHERIVQVVMIDASGGVDKQRHRIYFFVTPCVADALPLVIIITDSEKESVFVEALQYFKELLQSSVFYSQQYPQIFLMDNDLKEISAINKIYS
ncbi:hypothetical protein AVEN_244251-1 [Araneus ventricosus]|uniref:MULE transposase domain-containing protein n=1 Tax=Araneus ventricosus TaxID=182803 RepID=A0A4Y2PN62_ARAVE|nr:hypothetical protein AVEN_244251-1 [Araneus ventricosus]